MKHESYENVPCRWESGELGFSVEHARPVSPEHETAVDAALGLQLVPLRLPKTLLDELDLIARKEGLACQALIRRVLARFAATESGKNTPATVPLAEDEAQLMCG